MPSIYAGYDDGGAEHTFLHNPESLQSDRNLDRAITRRFPPLGTLFCARAGSLASFHVIFGRSLYIYFSPRLHAAFEN
jgi:hypothetical protein